MSPCGNICYYSVLEVLFYSKALRIGILKNGHTEGLRFYNSHRIRWLGSQYKREISKSELHREVEEKLIIPCFSKSRREPNHIFQ